MRQLGFGEVGVGFDFLNLVGVAFAVRGDQQNKFVRVPLLTGGAVGSVIAEARSGFEEVLGLGAAGDEVVDGGLRRPEAVVGLDFGGGLDFIFARGDVGDDTCLNGGGVAPRSGGGLHDAGFHHAQDEIFGGGDVLHAFGDGPAIGGGLEVPLRGREALGGVEDAPLGRFEVGEGLFFVGGG